MEAQITFRDNTRIKLDEVIKTESNNHVLIVIRKHEQRIYPLDVVREVIIR